MVYLQVEKRHHPIRGRLPLMGYLIGLALGHEAQSLNGGSVSPVYSKTYTSQRR